jgi:hypothetical protein
VRRVKDGLITYGRTEPILVSDSIGRAPSEISKVRFPGAATPMLPRGGQATIISKRERGDDRDS